MPDIRFRLRNKVREVRTERGLSISELAAESGIDRHVVGVIDRDAGHEPSYRTSLRLAEVLGEPVESLFWSERIDGDGNEVRETEAVS